jgi:polyisoprenoid-binding protein YceI
MRRSILFITAGILFLAVSAFTIQAIINWQIDNTTAQAKFSIGHTKGFFTGVKGDISFDKDDLAGSFFNCTIDVATVNTGSEGRDEHLRTADFFDVSKFPVMTFKSTKVERELNGFIATGNLTIKDYTKEIHIPFTFEENKGKGIFKGSVIIDRNDYGVGKPEKAKQNPWGGTPGIQPDPILISLEIPVDKK